MVNSWQDKQTLPSTYENAEGPILISNGNK